MSRALVLTAVSTALVVPAAASWTASPAAASLTIPRASARTVVQPPGRQITYRQWDTQRQLASGRFVGTRSVRGVIQLDEPAGTLTYADPHGYRTKRYDFGRWLSPWQSPGYAFDQLIPSWDATTPRDSWVQIRIRGRSESGRLSTWYTMANWAAGDRFFHRTSLGSQTDDLAQVDVDTLKARYSMGFTSWQMSITLLRRTGTTVSPTVDTAGAVTSLLPAVTRVPTSRPGVASGIRLRLPRYSQMIHQGDYPQYDGGGEAWCSPTSVSMLLGYDRRSPSDREISWVPTAHPDRWVDHAARSQYDYGFEGAGNWSFSAAYAAEHADSAFVTRLRSLREAERFIKAGIPLVASVRYAKGQLTGAPISSTNGHLLVIVGFAGNGDVVVNDPAAPRARTVVRTYDRGQFENAWIPKSGGLVYVVRTRDQALPANRSGNW